ncbi:MAG: hypothetical protein GY913_03305 [Proteobacteria bacterium]|nr:hypothetical protein [Pseudomonadota bacterium]
MVRCSLLDEFPELEFLLRYPRLAAAADREDRVAVHRWITWYWAIESLSQGETLTVAKALRSPWFGKARSQNLQIVVLTAVFGPLLSAGLGALVAAGITSNVHVLNLFPYPLEVQLGDQVLTLAPNTRERLWMLPTGPVEILAMAPDGWIADQGSLDLRSTLQGANIWNVAGGAYVYREMLAYSTSPKKGPENTFRLMCGQRLIQLSGDHVFSEPPQEIKTKSDGVIWRSHIDWLPEAGFQCPQALAEDEEYDHAMALTEAWRDSSDRWWVQTVAGILVAQGQPSAALARIEDELEDADTVALHEARQDLAILLGRGGSMRAEYTSGLIRSPVEVLLAARIASTSQADELLVRALERDPGDRDLQVGLGRIRLHQARYAEAIELLDVDEPTEASAAWLAEAHMALGQDQSALAVLLPWTPSYWPSTHLAQLKHKQGERWGRFAFDGSLAQARLQRIQVEGLDA